MNQQTEKRLLHRALSLKNRATKLRYRRSGRRSFVVKTFREPRLSPKHLTGAEVLNWESSAKKRAISERYAFVAEIPLPEDVRKKFKMPIGATYGDAGAIGTFLAMIDGHWGAAKEIREAIEGRATQRIEVVGSDSGPIRVSLAETVERIREFYGLRAPTTTPYKSTDLDPLPAWPR